MRVDGGQWTDIKFLIKEIYPYSWRGTISLRILPNTSFQGASARRGLRSARYALATQSLPIILADEHDWKFWTQKTSMDVFLLMLSRLAVRFHQTTIDESHGTMREIAQMAADRRSIRIEDGKVVFGRVSDICNANRIKKSS